MTHHITSDGAAAVSPSTTWIPVGPFTPRGVKMLLISRKYGVAQTGTYNPNDPFFTHWAPLPIFKRTGLSDGT
jgi:hypothetical protein